MDLQVNSKSKSVGRWRSRFSLEVIRSLLQIQVQVDHLVETASQGPPKNGEMSPRFTILVHFKFDIDTCTYGYKINERDPGTDSEMGASGLPINRIDRFAYVYKIYTTCPRTFNLDPLVP
jgi:hypothetical protein